MTSNQLSSVVRTGRFTLTATMSNLNELSCKVESIVDKTVPVITITYPGKRTQEDLDKLKALIHSKEMPDIRTMDTIIKYLVILI